MNLTILFGLQQICRCSNLWQRSFFALVFMSAMEYIPPQTIQFMTVGCRWCWRCRRCWSWRCWDRRCCWWPDRLNLYFYPIWAAGGCPYEALHAPFESLTAPFEVLPAPIEANPASCEALPASIHPSQRPAVLAKTRLNLVKTVIVPCEANDPWLLNLHIP